MSYFGKIYKHIQYGSFVIIADLLLIISISFLVGWFYHHYSTPIVNYPEPIAGVGFISAIGFTLLMSKKGSYTSHSSFDLAHQCLTSAACWLLVSVALIVTFFLLKIFGQLSRGFVLIYFCLTMVGIISVRIIFSVVSSKIKIKNFRVSRNFAIILPSYGKVTENLEDFDLSNYNINYILTANHNNSTGNCLIGESDLRRLSSAISRSEIDEILIVMRSIDVATLYDLRKTLEEFPVPVGLLFDKNIQFFISHQIVNVGANRILQVQGAPLSISDRFIKRLFDVLFSAIGILLLIPIMLIIAASVKIDSSGPFLFYQRRVGFNAKTFWIYKFRTMADIDEGENVEQATRGDPRVTRVGKFLRSTSLDELPQLFNVLRGNMSLVGPRPHAVAHDTKYAEILSMYALRHHMKPGITGWAQVNGARGETETITKMASRISLDVWYVNNWTLYLDVKIILMTCIQIFRNKDVY